MRKSQNSQSFQARKIHNSQITVVFPKLKRQKKATIPKSGVQKNHNFQIMGEEKSKFPSYCHKKKKKKKIHIYGHIMAHNYGHKKGHNSQISGRKKPEFPTEKDTNPTIPKFWALKMLPFPNSTPRNSVFCPQNLPPGSGNGL